MNITNCKQYSRFSLENFPVLDQSFSWTCPPFEDAFVKSSFRICTLFILQDKELTIYLLCDRLRIHFHCSHMCLHLMVGETFYVYTVVMFGNFTTRSCCYTLLQSCLYLIHRILVASSFNVKSNFDKNQ